MALIDRIRGRSPAEWSPEALDKLTRTATAEEEKLRKLLEQTRQQLQEVDESRGSLRSELEQTAQEAEQRLAGIQQQLSGLDAVRDQLTGFQERLDHYDTQQGELGGDFRRLQEAADSLQRQLDRIHGDGEKLRTDLQDARSQAEGIDDILSGLATARTLAQKSDEQIHRLNALAEHVGQKLTVLQGNQQALERADRLSETLRSRPAA